MNQRHFQQQCQSLYLILKGCLNERTIQQSTQLLKKKAIQQQQFIHQLCFLINKAEADTLIMIMSTLKNFLMARYNNQQEPISNHQKDFLKNNIFKIFYQIYPRNAPIKIYKEIIYIMIAVDYPWPGLFDKIQQDLNNSIIASIFFMRQIAKVNEWFVAQEDRKIIEEFIIQYFPKIENVINKIFQNFNPQTSELLHQVLKTFYSAFHIEIPFYLRNLDNLDRWIMYFETILNAPTESVGLKNQQMASRIYYKFFTLYCNSVSENKNYSNWVRQFIIRFAQRLFQTIVNLIGQKKGSQTLLSNLINCLHQVIKSQQLRPLYTNQHCQILFYGNILLPMCQSNNDQLNIFKNDPIQYIRRQDDLTCQPIRRAILDTIQIAASSLNFNGKSQMIRIVQYSANVLQTSTNDLQKQVIIRILSKIGKLILKNKHLKSQFQNLTIQYFIPLLTNENPLLNATVCQLLSLYLPFGELDNQTVSTLMELIYDKIVNSKYLVVKYNAILSFTALLNHKTALQATMPYFKNILEIYVSMLNTFDHQNLLDCLQSIVKYFSSEIVGYAPELITHLLTMFSSLSKNNGQQDQDEDEPDTNNSAKAALSTIKEILMCQLSPETYFNISKDLFQLYRGIFNQFDSFFDEILTLMNVLIYKSKEVFQYQYIYVSCRKLLEQKFYIHPNAFSNDIAQQLSKIQTSDNQFEESLVSILKNLIQKMPLQVLYKYSFPSHPQLIFCLIQNQKLRPQDFNNLNTSQLNDLWTQYISSYTFMIYGIGSMSNTNTLKSIIGVSLFPWIKNGLNIELVKIIINSVEEQNEQDEDMYEENTAQLLQKYANEDDEQQEEYYEGLGTNYSLLYDSPFDSTKDKNQLIQQLKSLPQIEANNLFNLLSNTYRKKLQILLN